MRPTRQPEHVPESTRRLLRTMGTPALVLGRHLDVLAYNELAEALLGSPSGERNMLKALFRFAEARDRCPDWESMALDYTAEPGSPDDDRLRLLGSNARTARV